MLSLTPKRKKTLIFAAGSMLAAFAIFSGLLPTLIKEKLPAYIEQATGNPTALTDVKLSLLPFAVRLDGFTIQDPSKHPLAAFDNLYLEIDPLHSLSQLALVVNRLALNKPFVRLSKQQDGRLNIDNLLAKPADSQPVNDKLFAVTIAKLSVTEGKLVYEDAQQAHPLSTTVYPLQLDVAGFDTYTDQPSSLKMSLGLDSGASIDWTGSFGIKPFRSEGQIKLAQIDLKKILALSGISSLQGLGQADLDYHAAYNDDEFKLAINNAKFGFTDVQYGQANLSLKLAGLNHETDLTLSYKNNNWQLAANKAKISGQQLQIQEPVSAKAASLSAETAYQLNYADNRLNFIAKQGSIETKNLQLSQPKQEQPVADIPSILIRGIDFNLGDQQIKADAVTVNDADVKAWLYADGSINYQSLIANTGNQPSAAAEPKAVEKKTPWRLQTKAVALTNCALNFTDETLTTPTSINLKPINLTLTDYNNQPGIRLPLQLDVGVNKNGSIKINGEASLAPIAAELDIDIKNIDLEKFQSYLAKFIHLDIIDGLLNINGKLAIAKPEPLDLTFTGNTTITDLLTRDQRVHKDFVKWANLSLSDISANTLANRYTAAQLTIERPYARVTIRKDKTVNFSNLLVVDETIPKATVTKPQPQPPAYFKLGKIKITDGSSDFTDLSLILPFSAYIQDLQGGASGLSSETSSSIKVSLKGNAYDLSPVDISGNISPYLGDYDIQVNFYGLPMPLVSPYMVQFAGYKVEKGKMSLGLNYKVGNKKLTAMNKLSIDQFELGEKVDNPDAVSIPLKFAVALLKDSSGKIKFDFPISGSLENPQFSIGAIVTDALTNAIGKIISSPFAALASLTDSEEDLSTISFSPGSAELTQQQQAKLNELAAAMRERPVLTIGVKGTAYLERDWPAISDDALYDQLKIRRAAEINKEAEIKIRSEYVELSNEQYQRLLADMFIEKFPLLAEKSLLGIPKLKTTQTGDFYEIAKQKLMEVINPEQERLKELSVARARAIAKYLVQHGQIGQDRVFILDTLVDKENANKEILSVLALKAD